MSITFVTKSQKNIKNIVYQKQSATIVQRQRKVKI